LLELLILQYQLLSGSNSRLPQGLTLQPNGLITGKVSFNTFALDGGSTTFDVLRTTRLDPTQTTFDLEFNFTVNAFAPQTEQPGYEVTAIVVTNGGSGFDPANPPTIAFSGGGATSQAIATVTIANGSIVAYVLVSPGYGYTSQPIITVTPTEVPYKVEAAAPVIETAPIVTIEAPVKKIRSSTPKTKSAKAAKTKK
jgi:hypothetical protein